MTSTAGPPSSSDSKPPKEKPPRPRSPRFPPHNAPRVWVLTNGTSPIKIALARQALEHGDYVLAGVPPSYYEREREVELAQGDGEQQTGFQAFLEEVRGRERWRERLRVVGLDGRVMGQCQAAVAEAVEAFGRVDVLLGCTGEGESGLSWGLCMRWRCAGG